MSARRETLRKFALVTKIDVLFEKREEKERGEEEEKGKEKEKEKGKKEEKPTSAWQSLHGLPDDNPVIVSEELQRTLREGASSCDFPFLVQDAFQVFFACIQTEEGYVYLGPLSMARMDKPSERRFYLHYGINPEDVHSLRVYTLQEILYLVELADQILTGRTYEDTQLLYLNHLNKMDPDAKGRQQALFLLEEEDKNEDEEDVWRHTYREERGLMDSVREGRVEDALRLSRLMDQDCGRLSRQEV
ncbi:MAG: hypothetical protein IIZ39_10495, partial [Blautia sp.]|nr:hypothetical protein [Blautia sp.]